MWKVIVFFAPFLAKFWWMFKSTIKIGISAHFQKQTKKKNDHLEGLLSGPSKGYYLGQVRCNIKMANLAQIITLQMFAHTFFKKQKCWNPCFSSAFLQTVLKKTNLAQIITLQMAKLGADNNSTAAGCHHGCLPIKARPVASRNLCHVLRSKHCEDMQNTGTLVRARALAESVFIGVSAWSWWAAFVRDDLKLAGYVLLHWKSRSQATSPNICRRCCPRGESGKGGDSTWMRGRMSAHGVGRHRSVTQLRLPRSCLRSSRMTLCVTFMWHYSGSA